MSSGNVILTKTYQGRTERYALEYTDAALQILDDYMTVSDAPADDVQAARGQLQDTNRYEGIGGTWELQRVGDDAQQTAWYELWESSAGYDAHTLNRTRAERIRAERLIFGRVLSDTERQGITDAMEFDDEMIQALIDAGRAEMVTVGGVHDARADLVTARQTILRAVEGHDDADLPAAAAMLDHALRALCPHDPGSWYTADHRGRSLTTCNECGVSWYEHEPDQLPF